MISYHLKILIYREEGFQLQSHALGTRTKFQLEILTMNVISDIVYFREIVLESLLNVSDTIPWGPFHEWFISS